MKRAFALSLLLLGGCATPQKPERVIFWHSVGSPVARKVLERLVATYNQRTPGVEVVPVMAGRSDTLLSSIQRVGASKACPDLVWGYPAMAAQLAASGVAVPLNDYLEDRDFDRSSLYSVLWEASTSRGQVWGLPFDNDTLAIFYNRDHFREAGVKIPGNWSEFHEVAQKLSRDLDGDGKPDRYGFMIPYGKEEWAVWTWQTLLWQAGGDILDHGRPVFDSPAGVRALSFWRSLLHDGSAYLSAKDLGARPDDFLAGKASMFIGGPWLFTELPHNFPYGVFPLPRDRYAVTNIGGESLFLIKRGTDRQRRSWNFAKYLVSQEAQATWAMATGYLPANRRIVERPNYRNLLLRQPAKRVFLEGLEYGRVRPCLPAYPMLSEAIGLGLVQGLSGATDPSTALREARKVAETRLKYSAADTLGGSAPDSGKPVPAQATPRSPGTPRRAPCTR